MGLYKKEFSQQHLSNRLFINAPKTGIKSDNHTAIYLSHSEVGGGGGSRGYLSASRASLSKSGCSRISVLPSIFLTVAL